MPSNKPCSYDGCSNRHRRGGYCHSHNMQKARTGEMWPIGSRPRLRGTCTFPGCDRPHHSHGYCDGHRLQLRRGAPLTPLEPAAPKKVRPKDLPAGPLCAYARAHGYEIEAYRKRLWVSLAEADEMCVKVFKGHPFFVYGDAWWDKDEMEAA